MEWLETVSWKLAVTVEDAARVAGIQLPSTLSDISVLSVEPDWQPEFMYRKKTGDWFTWNDHLFQRGHDPWLRLPGRPLLELEITGSSDGIRYYIRAEEKE